MAKNWREEAGKRLKEKQQSGSRFKLSEGDNSIRVLPNAKGSEFKPFLEFNMHYNVGPDKKGVRCGKNIHGEGACWMCDKFIPKLMASGKKSKKMIAEAMVAKEQFVVQVAILDSDSGKFRGPHLWAVSAGGAKSLSAKLLGVIKSTKRDYVDPKNGYNLNIERTGTNMDTVYGAIIPDEDPSKVPDSLLAKVKRFSELVDQYDEDKQKAAYFGRAAEEEEEESTEEEAEGEETEEEEESTEEDSGEEGTEEEEEEETPKPKTGKKKPKKPAHAEEEEEEAEEEENPDAAEDSGEEEVPEEEEEEVPSDDDDGEGTGEEEEPEEEEEEAPKPKKPAPKPGKKPLKKHGTK